LLSKVNTVAAWLNFVVPKSICQSVYHPGSASDSAIDQMENYYFNKN
jgi:hypothetical protein